MKKDEINYITPEGLNQLQQEYDLLARKERPEIVSLVSWAASLGDRSENADYLYGKKRLREIDRRLRFLQKRISLAKVIDPKEITSLKVQFSAKVEGEDLDSGETWYYQIVGTDEINVKEGKISWKSPIGRSLMGKEVGDEIILHAPGGDRHLMIHKITYGDTK